MIVGGVGNGAVEEDWCWDLKPRHGSHTRERTTGFWGRRERATWFGGEEKGERGPYGFGGEGREDRSALAEWEPNGSDTADGAGA